MIILVTGAYGFIGSNIVRALNQLGYKDILAVDDLSNSTKFANLVDCEILDYIDKNNFIKSLSEGDYDNHIDYIFHQGACSDTTLTDGEYMMRNNYEYSTVLLDYAQKNQVPLVYASSAAIYGRDSKFAEIREDEKPINIYGYSKFLFDQLVRRYVDNGITAPIVGLRYFNVYGYGEFHKKNMASMVLHTYNQYKKNNYVNLFANSHGYQDGEHLRDFICIDDIVKINIHFFKNHLNETHEISGIFNCGTGIKRSFNDLALITINACRKLQGQSPYSLSEAQDLKIIRYIAMPNDLHQQYQPYTVANIKWLSESGVKLDFDNLEQGITKYVGALSLMDNA